MTHQTPPIQFKSYQALLGKDWKKLHPDIQKRFTPSYGQHKHQYRGRMSTIFLSFAGKLFAQCCRLIGKPYCLRSGVDIPIEVKVFPDPKKAGITWDRFYYYQNPRNKTKTIVDRVRSTKCLTNNGLVEVIGFGMGMALQLSVENEALVFTSRHYFINIFGKQIKFPHLLTPGLTVVKQKALGNHTFEFSLSCDHPFLGRVFWQTGVFEEL